MGLDRVIWDAGYRAEDWVLGLLPAHVLLRSLALSRTWTLAETKNLNPKARYPRSCLFPFLLGSRYQSCHEH